MHCTSGSGYGVILRISPDIWYESRSHAVLNMTSLDRLRTFHSFVLTFPYDHVILRDTCPFINGFATPTFSFNLYHLSDRRREHAGEQRGRLRRGAGHPQHLRHVLDQRLHRQRRTRSLPLWGRGKDTYKIQVSLEQVSDMSILLRFHIFSMIWLPS